MSFAFSLFVCQVPSASRGVAKEHTHTHDQAHKKTIKTTNFPPKYCKHALIYLPVCPSKYVLHVLFVCLSSSFRQSWSSQRTYAHTRTHTQKENIITTNFPPKNIVNTLDLFPRVRQSVKVLANPYVCSAM